jgi:hypothetical protein
MWQTLVPLHDSGYELDQLVVCTNSKTNQTVYIVTAKRMPSSEKKKKVLRKKPSLPEDGWKEMFPGSTRDNFRRWTTSLLQSKPHCGSWRVTQNPTTWCGIAVPLMWMVSLRSMVPCVLRFSAKQRSLWVGA